MKVSQQFMLGGLNYMGTNVEIREIYIDGFRNVMDTRIVFDNQITTLLSNNNYGKSNIFSAISSALRFISSNKLHQILFIKQGYHCSINKNAKNKPFHFEIVIRTPFEGADVDITYNYVVSWKHGIISENLSYKKVVSGGGAPKRLLKRDEKSAQYCSSQQGRCLTSLECAKTELALTMLSYMPSYPFSVLVNAISSLAFGVYSDLDAKSSYNMPSAFSIEDFGNFEIPIDSIEPILFELNRDYPDEFARLKNAFLTLFEQYVDIRIVQYMLNLEEDDDDESDEIEIFPETDYNLYFVDRNHVNPDEIDNLSNGTLRVLCMFTNAVVASIKKLPLLGFEELETGIHPALMSGFLQAVLDLAGDTKILLTTHSTSIVQFLRPESIYVGNTSKNGLATFRRFPPAGIKQLKQASKAYGVSDGEYIFKLLSSGDEGVEELKLLLN